MKINRTRTNENQTSFESNTLTIMISAIHKMVIVLFVLLLATTIYWHYMDQSFPIFSFIRWGLIMAGLTTAVMVFIIFRRQSRTTERSVSYSYLKGDIPTGSEKFSKPGK